MAFEKVCSVDDLWEGEMQEFPLSCGKRVLVVKGTQGDLRAFDAICPHQEYPLIEGDLDDDVLTCSMHLWQFDIKSGEGVNPTGCKLKSYEIKTLDDDIFVNAGNTT